MNKSAFTDELYQLLKPLPKAERRQHIDYYEEMINDRMEDGLSEEEAVAALGSPSDIAAQILGDVPPKSVRKRSGWSIVLIVLGSPIWLSLLVCAAMAAASVVVVAAAAYISLWTSLAALYAACLGLLLAFFGGIVSGIYYLVYSVTAPGFLFLGGALACAGGAILLFFLCNYLTVLLWKLGKWTVQKIIGIFRGKGGKK